MKSHLVKLKSNSLPQSQHDAALQALTLLAGSLANVYASQHMTPDSNAQPLIWEGQAFQQEHQQFLKSVLSARAQPGGAESVSRIENGCHSCHQYFRK
jgi:cytochrome c556